MKLKEFLYIIHTEAAVIERVINSSVNNAQLQCSVDWINRIHRYRYANMINSIRRRDQRDALAAFHRVENDIQDIINKRNAILNPPTPQVKTHTVVGYH